MTLGGKKERCSSREHSKSKRVEARNFGTLAQLCSEKAEDEIGTCSQRALGATKGGCQLPHCPDNVIWLLSGRAGSTFGVLERAGGVPWLEPTSLTHFVHPQLSATFTIPFWQWFLTQFGKKTAVYIGISVSGAEGTAPRLGWGVLAGAPQLTHLSAPSPLVSSAISHLNGSH